MIVKNKDEKEGQKKPYLKPMIEIHTILLEKDLMIAVSGTTTPEESQAKTFDLWTDEEDDLWGNKNPDLWDDEEED